MNVDGEFGFQPHSEKKKRKEPMPIKIEINLSQVNSGSTGKPKTMGIVLKK